MFEHFLRTFLEITAFFVFPKENPKNIELIFCSRPSFVEIPVSAMDEKGTTWISGSSFVLLCGLIVILSAGALTQISAYITHKKMAIRKIVEAMGTAYAENGTWSQHIPNYTRGKRSQKARECGGRKARIVCGENFISLNQKGL